MPQRNLQKVLSDMAKDEIKPEAKGLHNDYVSLEQLQKHIKKKYKDVDVQHTQETVDVCNLQTGEYLHTNYKMTTVFTVGNESESTSMSVQLRDPSNPQTLGLSLIHI